MIMAVKRLLDSFHELSEPKGHGLVVEILRCTVFDVASLPDDDLVMTAEALFLDLDRREAQSKQPRS
jgi:hypothetical protein